MRVVFLATEYPTPDGREGCVFHRTLAEALTRAGATVEVVAPIPRVPFGMGLVNRRWALYQRIPKHYRLGNVTVHRPRHWQLPRANHLGLRHSAFARCLLTTLEPPPDVIHAHFSYPSGMASLEAAAFWRVPTVLTLHGSDVNVFPTVNRRTRELFVRAVRGASAVTAVSHALADRTEQLTGRRPAVMPIGIELGRIRDLPTRSEARRRLGLPEQVPLVLFVGRLLEAKGVLLLREALDLLGRDDVVGVFVGDGPLQERIAGHSRCRTVGAVPNEKVMLYMRACDMLVLPSFMEGMPTVIVEAGGCGLPVIATSVGGIPELLDLDRGVLIAPGRVDELVLAIRTILEDPIGAQERATRLSQTVQREYDVDKNAQALLRIYESLRRESDPGRQPTVAAEDRPIGSGGFETMSGPS